ncbi:MFS transporter, partial [Mycobacterium tuberculosis]|nr:MFS transporter [Mycobacterium tuberculosis]
NPIIATALGAIFCITSVNIGLTIYTPAFLEVVHGLAPASTGTAMLTLMVGSVVGAAITGRAMRRDPHYRRYAVAGTALAAAVFAAMAATLPVLPFWAVEIGYFIGGTGFSPAFPAATAPVPPAT